jgi:DNA-binding PadR family transcriptional regulator
MHAYAIATQLEQVAEHQLALNQGTLYPALVRAGAKRLDQGGLAEDGKQSRGDVLQHHEGRQRALQSGTGLWRRLAGFVEKLLEDEA